MIKQRDVITMRIPFPNISSNLAVRAHMYICMQDGVDKEFVKCQTAKPIHKLSNRPPFNYIEEKPDPNRNPFQKTTIIDCDKSFGVNSVKISTDLLTSSRRDVCNNLFRDINNKINHDNFSKESLETAALLSLNNKISFVN